MTKAFILIFSSLLLCQQTFGATIFTCHNEPEDVVLNIVIRNNSKYNEFTFDSPTHSFISRGKKLQIVKHFESYHIQATALNNPHLFAQIAVDVVSLYPKDLLTDTFITNIRIHDGNAIEIPVMCQAIIASE